MSSLCPYEYDMSGRAGMGYVWSVLALMNVDPAGEALYTRIDERQGRPIERGPQWKGTSHVMPARSAPGWWPYMAKILALDSGEETEITEGRSSPATANILTHGGRTAFSRRGSFEILKSKPIRIHRKALTALRFACQNQVRRRRAARRTCRSTTEL